MYEETGYTPLQIACVNELLEMIRFLLDRGANVNGRDNDGGTALQLAWVNVEVARLLLE